MVSLLFGLAVAGFLVLKENRSELQNFSSEEEIDNQAVYTERGTAIKNRGASVSPKLLPKANIFIESPEKVLQVLESVEDFMDSDKVRQEFRTSGLDSEETLAAALEIAIAPYSKNLSEDTVKKKVLVHHYLGLSEKLDENECIAALEKNIKMYSEEQEKQIKNALQWDIYSLAQICTHYNSTRVAELAEGEIPLQLSAQIKLAYEKQKGKEVKN